MSIASAGLIPNFVQSLANPYEGAIESNSFTTQGILQAGYTDNSNVVIDRVNRLVHIFLNVNGQLNATSYNAGGILWQYRAYGNATGNQLPSLKASVQQVNARISFNSTDTIADVALTNVGGNIDVNFINAISGLNQSPNQIYGTIIYPY
jgi:hypothetical protein